MGYTFRGFFTTHAEGLIADAAARWPGASVHVIQEQLEGIGVRLPEPDPGEPEQYQMVLNCEDELPAWSKCYPQNTFVYILVECFGGPCDHIGYACKNGDKIDAVDEEQEGGLGRLMSHLGVKLGSTYSHTYFRPFERDFPW